MAFSPASFYESFSSAWKIRSSAWSQHRTDVLDGPSVLPEKLLGLDSQVGEVVSTDVVHLGRRDVDLRLESGVCRYAEDRVELVVDGLGDAVHHHRHNLSRPAQETPAFGLAVGNSGVSIAS